ncbi:hypothetical protein JCM3770_004542 [Rhodotorula araucariae]
MRTDSAADESVPSAMEGIEKMAAPADNERGGDATVSAPRRRVPSPISTRQDSNRPFAFKRQSSGFTSFINSIASPTSEVRTRPATPAESATRSTFFTGTAISDSPPSASTPVFSTSPATTLAPLDIPSGPAPLTAPTPLSARFADRPKGEGTLELERVLGMWASKTPTSSSYPNLPPLPGALSSSTAPSASTPLFSQTVVTAEPESLDLTPAATAQPAASGSALSSFSSVFADFAQLASLQPSASSSRDLLDLPPLPRRQRSKSEADIMSVDFSLGPMQFVSTHHAAPPLPLDVSHRFLPSFSQPTPPPQISAYSPSMDPSDVTRPPSAPSVYTTSSAPTASEGLQLQQHDLALRARPSFTHQRSCGGPGYREAAFLEVSGTAERGRRARSQGLGHRRSAKSDDLTHLFSPTTASSFVQQQYQQQAAYASANGHLAPPDNGPPPSSMAGSPPAHPTFPGSGPRQQHQVIYVPSGQSLPIPLAYLASIDPVTGQPVLTPASEPQQQRPHRHQQYQQQQQSSYQARSAHPQFSPQGNALALAAAQAAQAHAASVAQATVAAATALQYNGGGETGRRPSAAMSAHSRDDLPRGLGAAGHAGVEQGQQHAPYAYHSPVAQNLPMLPSPPGSQANGASPEAASSSAGAGGARRRSRSAAVAAAAAMKRERSDSFDEEGEEEDAEGDEDDEMRDEPYGDEDEDDDNGMDYYDDDRAHPSLRAPAVSKGRKKAAGAPGSGAKKGGRGAAASALGAEEDEFTKESKTTQATIDAAKRRRNANAVAKFVCELCGETFTRRYNLRGHQRAHKGEKPYKCSYDGCDKSFARAHDCKRHELLHLGVRKYHCSPCKRDFVRLDALHRHHRSEVGQVCVKQLQSEGVAFDEKGAQIL